MMNKRLLVEKIIAHLDEEIARYAKAARTAQAEATDEQSRAENKYDTRGLEASYLAHGQSRQTMETGQARQQFAALVLRDFGPQEPIGPGALIELERKGERAFYFLGPSAGGTEVLHENREVLVLTVHSPLGRQLLGKREGDRLPEDSSGTPGGFRIVTVA